MAELTLRPTTAADAALVAGILAASYGTLWQGAYSAEALAAVLPMVTRARPDLLASGRYFLALEGEEAVSVGGWSLEDPATGVAQPGLGHVRHFATHPAHLRKGAAGLILRRCITEAAAEGLGEMLCIASLPSEAFYAASGFRTLRLEEVRIAGRIIIPSLVMRRALGG